MSRLPFTFPMVRDFHRVGIMNMGWVKKRKDLGSHPPVSQVERWLLSSSSSSELLEKQRDKSAGRGKKGCQTSLVRFKKPKQAHP